MDIAVIDENHHVVFASTTEMRLLFTYICDPYKEVDWEEVDGFMYIYDLYDDEGSVPPVKIRKEKRIEILEQWRKIKAQSSKQILVRKEGENFIFKEVDYGRSRQAWKREKAINLEGLKFKNSNIFKEPGEIFNGGFHYISEIKSKEKNYKLMNESYGRYCVFMSDMMLTKDFTINHAFFPRCWTSIEVKNQIVKALNSLLNKCKYVEVEDKIFSIYGHARKGTTIQVLINDKNEVLTAYPIFWIK